MNEDLSVHAQRFSDRLIAQIIAQTCTGLQQMVSPGPTIAHWQDAEPESSNASKS